MSPAATATIRPLSADLTDLLDKADLPWTLSRWGFPTITYPGGECAVRISEDDSTFYLTVLSGGKAELIHSQMQFSGLFAQAAMLSALDAVTTECL